MKTVYLNSSNLEFWKNQSKPNVMALGFFDGIHSGHKNVIQTAGQLAKEKGMMFSVMSFFPHPKTVIQSKEDSDFDYLMPTSKKASVIESLGVDTLYIVEFDKDFLSLPPKQFVSHYLLDLKVHHAVAGFDFSYGHRGLGNIDCLSEDSNGKIDVTKVEKVDYHGEKINSTWIRKLISEGEMDKLINILGRYYETEVQWVGECFKIAPYYMLPPAGYYQVIIKAKGKSRKTTVYIPVSKKEIYLVENIKHHFIMNEKFDIIWSHKIPIGKIAKRTII